MLVRLPKRTSHRRHGLGGAAHTRRGRRRLPRRWDASESEPEGAARIDARAVDPDGEQAWISLVWTPGGVSLLFDDVAVSHAIRSVLAMLAPDALSTLSQGDDRFVGAVTVVHDEGGGHLRYQNAPDPTESEEPQQARRLQLSKAARGE